MSLGGYPIGRLSNSSQSMEYICCLVTLARYPAALHIRKHHLLDYIRLEEGSASDHRAWCRRILAFLHLATGGRTSFTLYGVSSKSDLFLSIGHFSIGPDGWVC